MIEQVSLLPGYLTAHLQLTLLALLVSTVVSVPLGIAVTRMRWLEQPVLGLAGIIQTVPSLALLAVIVPILASLELQSIGFLPAIIGLTLYGVLPVLRNTVTGISGIDPLLKEAARSVGMTAHQQLTIVELPLATPIIVAGVRTATVWIVGIATLSTPVGATSLGNYIFSGLQTRNYTAILVGCVAAAGLALLLDALIRALEIAITRKRRGQFIASLTIIVGLFSYAGFTFAVPLLGNQARPIVVGSKTFTEQYILSAAIARWIEQETDHKTTVLQSLGSIVAFDALAAGQIDVYVDYSGTLWANEMGRGGIRAKRSDIVKDVRQFLIDKHGITIAAALGFENSYTLAVRAADAQRLSLRTVSDLDSHAPNLVIGGDYEFFARPEWSAVQNSYRLTFREQRMMDSTLMYQAVATGAVDVISAFSSDGRITAYNLQVLDDNKDAIPPYDALVLTGTRLSREAPSVLAALRQLDGALDVNLMRNLNLRVDEFGETPDAVAATFIEKLSATTLVP